MAVLVAILIMLHCAIFGIGVSTTSSWEADSSGVPVNVLAIPEDDSDASSEAGSIDSAESS